MPKIVSVYLDENTVRKLDKERALLGGKTRSWLIKKIIEKYLKEKK